MPSPAGPAELLSDLAAALDAIDARWFVFGAQAAADHLVGTLDTHGFSLRMDATETFIRTTRVVPLEHHASGLALDVVLAGPGLEDLFLERAVAIDVAGTSFPSSASRI